MKRSLLLAAAGLLFVQTQGNAQSVRRCVTDEAVAKMLQEKPELAAGIAANKAYRAEKLAAKAMGSTAKTTNQVTIPVVFHIVLTASQQNVIGGANGIKKRVDSQIAVINRDFNKLNPDAGSIPNVFKPLHGDAQITFALAHRKPDGTSTPGYEIVTTTNTSFSAMSGSVGSGYLCSDAKFAQSGGANAWDLSDPGAQYLNIWVVNFSEQGILGIATPTNYPDIFPDFTTDEVGAVIYYKAFGVKPAASTDVYLGGAEGGRTLTHELGHVFGLDHIWGNTSVGSGNCGDDDGIGDTPQQEDANSSNCPTFPKANCTNSTGGEMFMNYMDYVVDNCYRMFTLEQCDVMNSDVVSGSGSTMAAHPELTQWPTAIEAVATGNFEVYPNPATSYINISAAAGEHLKTILISDLTGRIIKNISTGNASINEYHVDMSNLPKGMYLVQCTFASGTATKKIVLQ